MHLHLEHSDLVCLIFLSCADEFYFVAWLDGSVENLEICNDASERVEYRVKDESLERSVRISCRSWNALDDGVKNLRHSLSCLS